MSALLSFPESSVHERTLAVDSAKAAFRTPPDYLSIRGVRLPVDELVDQSLFVPEHRQRLRHRLLDASPFPHLVLDGIFNPDLLDLVAEEFDMVPESAWAEIRSKYECTRRSVLGVALGPAQQVYFDIVNSGWFTEWLSSLTDVAYLLPDPKLFGGGLHESRNGASFAVHRDFNHHRHLGLKNEMVFITYLNKGWDPEWGSALELWDKKANHIVSTVQPEFGRTILLPHGQKSYHGHTKVLQTPDGRPRRSVAAYYYTSPLAGKLHGDESASVFMRPARVDKVKTFARMIVPPVVWALGRKITGR
ncbi:2OG-Fe(II) oxygenase [Variovorax sp. GT1P44]|uniref:2OG-Fe(II) oxygenase n=1 Tax=Variovorax sp. GT1P44 TaxID=3443742 RepID=UPI003F48523C